MGDTNTFRMRLKHWRMRRALNIRQLSHKSRVSSATIVKIENNQEYIPRPDVINKLAKALDVQIDDLLEDEEERPVLAAS